MSILRARCVNMHKSQWRCSKNGTMAQSISDTMGCFIWQELSHLRQSGHQTIDPWLQQLTQHMAKDPQHLNCMSKLLGLSISSPVDTFSWCMLADIGFPRIFPWVFQGFPLFFHGVSQILHDFPMGFPSASPGKLRVEGTIAPKMLQNRSSRSSRLWRRDWRSWKSWCQMCSWPWKLEILHDFIIQSTAFLPSFHGMFFWVIACDSPVWRCLEMEIWP